MSSSVHTTAWSGSLPGPRVLLLHGFLGHPEDWQATRESYGASGEWVAPFLPGHGENPFPLALQQYKIGLKKLAGEQLFDYCIGYSLGGRLACSLHGEDRPWKKLILIGAQPHPAATLSRFGMDLKRSVHLHLMNLRGFVATWYQQPLFAGTPMTAEFLQRRLLHRPAAIAPMLWKWSPAKLRIPNTVIPELVIYGAEDPVRPTQRPWPYLEVPGASHHVLAMAPSALGQALRQILTSGT